MDETAPDAPPLDEPIAPASEEPTAAEPPPSEPVVEEPPPESGAGAGAAAPAPGEGAEPSDAADPGDAGPGDAGADATGEAADPMDVIVDAFSKMAEAFDRVTSPGADADPAGNTAAERGAEDAGQLLNDLQDISFLRIGLIVAGTWLATWLIRKLLPYLADRGPSQLRLTLLGAVPIARLALLTLAILWVAQLVLNVTFQNFLVVAGAASVAIGFAFKDYVSSLIAGIVAVFERPYRPGDWVKVGENYGEVVSVGLRTVALRTTADDVVFVPHSKIWTENVANSNDGARTLLCVADFYVAPNHDADRVRAALYDVALTSAYLSYTQPVAVMLAETPWGTHYKVKAYPFDMRDQFAFVSDLTVRGKRAVAEAGGTEVAAPAPGPAAA